MENSTPNFEELVCLQMDERQEDLEGDSLRLLLANGFKVKSGMLFHEDTLHKETEEEGLAIDYLCQEWDYGFLPYGESFEDNLKRLFPEEFK